MTASTDDFLRSRLDHMIDLCHPLAVLASRMPRHEIEASLAHRFARQVKAGKKIEDIDLFGATVALNDAGVSNAGCPRLPLRLMASLLYPKNAFNESDEDVCQRSKEFGAKVGIATTLQGNLIVGARTFPGNPYNGHTLNEQLEQASILMQATGMQPETVYVDLGYRGIDIKHRGKFKSLTEQEKKMLKSRQVIKPIISHLKADHRMNRCHLIGADGNSLHAVLCAAGYNTRWFLRMIVKKGLSRFLWLLQAASLTDFIDLQRKLRGIFTVNPNKSGFMNWVVG